MKVVEVEVKNNNTEYLTVQFPIVTYGAAPTDEEVENIAKIYISSVQSFYREYYGRNGQEMDYLISYKYYGSFGVVDVLDYLTLVKIEFFGKEVKKNENDA